jgi:hypothetical protein
MKSTVVARGQFLTCSLKFSGTFRLLPVLSALLSLSRQGPQGRIGELRGHFHVTIVDGFARPENGLELKFSNEAVEPIFVSGELNASPFRFSRGYRVGGLTRRGLTPLFDHVVFETPKVASLEALGLQSQER